MYQPPRAHHEPGFEQQDRVQPKPSGSQTNLSMSQALAASPTKASDHDQDTVDGEFPVVAEVSEGERGIGSMPKQRRNGVKDTKFKCTSCDKSYSRAEHLYRHQLSHEPKHTIYKCTHPGCTREFVRQDLRDRHRDRHTAKGPGIKDESGDMCSTLSHSDPEPIINHTGLPSPLSSLNHSPYIPIPSDFISYLFGTPDQGGSDGSVLQREAHRDAETKLMLSGRHFVGKSGYGYHSPTLPIGADSLLNVGQSSAISSSPLSDTASSGDQSEASIDAGFARRKRRAVDSALSSLCAALDARLDRMRAHECSNGCKTDEATTNDSTSHSSEHHGTSGTAERGLSHQNSAKRSHSRVDGDDEDESDVDKRKKKSKQLDKGKKIMRKKFACPYYKRDRRKYRHHTGCPGPGWDEVHRIKTHLYARHALPVQCPRCWAAFKTKNMLNGHLQQDPSCMVRPNLTVLDGFTEEQEKSLRSRKRTSPDMTEEQKWKRIYAILFPDDDPNMIPSPYYDDDDDDGTRGCGEDHGGVEGFAVFVRRELPGLIRRELDVLIEDDFHDLEDRVRLRVQQLVLRLQPRLIQLYKDTEAVPDQSETADTSMHPPQTSVETTEENATHGPNLTTASLPEPVNSLWNVENWQDNIDFSQFDSSEQRVPRPGEDIEGIDVALDFEALLDPFFVAGSSSTHSIITPGDGGPSNPGLLLQSIPS